MNLLHTNTTHFCRREKSQQPCSNECFQSVGLGAWLRITHCSHEHPNRFSSHASLPRVPSSCFQEAVGGWALGRPRNSKVWQNRVSGNPSRSRGHFRNHDLVLRRSLRHSFRGVEAPRLCSKTIKGPSPSPLKCPRYTEILACVRLH